MRTLVYHELTKFQLLWLKENGEKDLVIINYYNNVFDLARSRVPTALDHRL